MKKLFLVIVLISPACWSQASFTFPFTNDAKWEYNVLNAFSAFPIGTITYRLGKDTLMPNGKVYKAFSNFFFRYEGTKLYQFSGIDSIEFVRYDFSKQKGDTIAVVRPGRFQFAIFISDDKNVVVFGRQRRVISVHSSNGSIWDTIADSIGIVTFNRDTDNSYELTGATISGTTFGNVTSVTDEAGRTPAETLLSNNYPNPANPSTIISFTIPSRLFVTLKIYDVLGKEVTSLANEELNAGSYFRTWNAATMPSGMYFYRLQVGGFTETKRMVLLR